MVERLVWFQLEEGSIAITYVITLAANTILAQFLTVLKDPKVDSSSRLEGVATADLKVYGNKNARVEKNVLNLGATLDNYGRDEDDPIVVQIPQIWFQFVDANTGAKLEGTNTMSVPLPNWSTVEKFRYGVKKLNNDSHLERIPASDLKVFVNRRAYDERETDEERKVERPKVLLSSATLDGYGLDEGNALIVEVPMPVRTRAREESKEEEGESRDKRHKGNVVTKWEWKKEEKPIYCLRKGTMFFADRDDAIKQLLKTHESNYNRALTRQGKPWTIPLVDNVFGLGKSTFGSEYIRSCRHLWDALPNKTPDDDYLDTLRKCHTIMIELTHGLLLDDNGNYDDVRATRGFLNRICAYFDEQYDSRPRALVQNTPYLDLVDILKKLISEVGPLFIVIDEVGEAFDHDKLTTDIDRREKFISFCRKFLGPLLRNSNLFFLVAGRASFLSYVGLRPTEKELSSSPFTFKHLSLHLLRPPAIAQIITKTYMDMTQTKTIKEQCKLDDDQVTTVAQHLFKTTFGHPRSLLLAFDDCHTYEDLVKHNVTDVPTDNVEWRDFAERMWSFHEVLEYMMDCALEGNSIDMSDVWYDQGSRAVTYDIIANYFGTAWEGTLQNAKLYMPSYIQRVILASVYPLKDLLEKVAPAIGQISIDYADMFELLCLARFQELF